MPAVTNAKLAAAFERELRPNLETQSLPDFFVVSNLWGYCFSYYLSFWWGVFDP